MSGDDLASDLSHRVVGGGYCVGCSACAAARPNLHRISRDEPGKLQAWTRCNCWLAASENLVTVVGPRMPADEHAVSMLPISLGIRQPSVYSI